jgi:protein-S-isoprenylcysteine O-methyltransferase Ste14
VPAPSTPPPESFVDALGRFFYRFRGVLPVPVALAAVVLSWRGHIEPGPGGAAVDEALNVVGLALCVLGAALRFVTIALVPEGTSANNRVPTARALNTTGPYAVVRHPLYLANAHLVAGLLLIANTPWAYALGAGTFFVAYLLIIRTEEALLARLFGDAWRSWAARVPAIVPKLSALPHAFAGPFAWKRAALREVNTLVAWGVSAVLLLGWEWFARGELYGAKVQALRAVLIALLVLWPVGKLLRVLDRRAG